MLSRSTAIAFVIGDATAPKAEGPKIIVHVCNDIGGWGRGFVVALSRRSPEPERRYRAWHRGEENQAFELGMVQLVQMTEDTWVANLIGQHDIRPHGGVPPIRYEAVREGLKRVAAHARELGASVHMPRIGCGLAGGKWDEVSIVIQQELCARGISVTVYDLQTSA